jgi:hypothetical protein
MHQVVGSHRADFDDVTARFIADRLGTGTPTAGGSERAAAHRVVLIHDAALDDEPTAPDGAARIAVRYDIARRRPSTHEAHSTLVRTGATVALVESAAERDWLRRGGWHRADTVPITTVATIAAVRRLRGLARSDSIDAVPQIAVIASPDASSNLHTVVAAAHVVRWVHRHPVDLDVACLGASTAYLPAVTRYARSLRVDAPANDLADVARSPIDVLAAASVVVGLPSTPVAVMQAASALGVPVIATSDTEPLRPTGVLAVPARKPLHLAEAILQVLTDRRVAERLIARQHAVVGDFDETAVLSGLQRALSGDLS